MHPGTSPPAAETGGTGEAPGGPPGGTAPRATLLQAASLLAGANLVAIVTGLVTGPIVARVLEPDGRGLLAAIIAPLTIAGQLAQFSTGEYATRRVARGASPGVVVGSLLPVVLATGVLSAATLIALGGTLAAGEPTVQRYLVIGALLLPLGLVAPILIGVASGRHRWGFAALSQSAGPLAYALAIVALAVAGRLTVESAAITTVLAGLAGLAVIAPGALRRRSPVRFDAGVAREGVGFGSRALPGVVAVFSNGRLDQVLMLGLAGPRQLGLYAVAVTYAAMTTSLIGAVGVAITPSVAAGDDRLVARTCRLALVVTTMCAGLAALAAYPMFLLIFGADFAAATGIALVLLVAQVPAAGSLVLGLSLRSMGRPGTVSIADVLGLVVTVPALFLVLPWIGAIGAAIVSLAAYSVVFAALLTVVVQHTGLPVVEFVAIRRSDVRESAIRLRGAAAATLARLPWPGGGVR